jgi:DNA-binding CsgD family transcriptional regulator/PAS domain-containing protein
LTLRANPLLWVRAQIDWGSGVMEEAERFAECIGVVYDAALEPALWRLALGKARGFVGGVAATLYWKDVVNKRGDIDHDCGVDPHYKKLYFEEYIKIDPLTCAQFFADICEPVATADVIDRDEFLETRIYREWAKPQGVVDFITAALEKSPTTAAFFGVFRHERNGVVDEGVRRRMRMVVPHIRRSVLIARTIEQRSTQAETFAAALDGLSAAMFLVDARARIVYANASGHMLLADGSVLKTASGKLFANDENARRILEDAFAAAANGDAAVGARAVATPLTGRNGDQYVAHLLPLCSGARKETGIVYSAVAAVFVHRAQLKRPLVPELIAKAHKLTPSELRVLLAVVDVGGVAGVAEALGVAANTVKTHLSRLYEKTGASRQADLVKLVARYSSPLLG